MQIDVDGLKFAFPADWQVTKYDEWVFYRTRFSKMWEPIKALDVLAVDPGNTVWFIEVKDYRRQRRTKPLDIADEVAHKVFDTLAAMLPAKSNANDLLEQEFAKVISKASRIRIIIHLEQPAQTSKLFPRAIDPADVQQKLRKLLKPIDAHPLVTERGMRDVAWTVT
jgi:hypothetical protein